MPLQPTIQIVINEKKSCNALNVRLQQETRGFKRHRSAEGADRLCFNSTPHKGSTLVPLVLYLSSYSDSTGLVWLWPSREKNKITTISLNLPSGSTAFSHMVLYFYIFLPLRRIGVNGYLSSARRTGKQALGETKNIKESLCG